MQQWSYVALAIAMIVILVVVLILASNILWILGLVGTIQDPFSFSELLDNLAKSLSIIRDVWLYLLEMILIMILIYLLYLLWRWFQENEGVFIQPFIVGTCREKYNGAAISDLLVAELIKIQSIHEKRERLEESGPIEEKERLVSKIVQSKETSGLPTVSETYFTLGLPIAAPSETSLSLPPFSPSSMNFAYEVSSVTVSGGPITVSVNQILTFFKKIGGRSGQIITGSIQEYDSAITLIAWMGTYKRAAWKVKRNFGDASISDMVTDLAFMIAMDVTKEKLKAKTWRGLKFYTEAMEEYNRYKLCGLVEMLSSSRELCLKAANTERDYTQPADLLYNIGLEYILIGNYTAAEGSFNEAIQISSRARLSSS